MRLYPAPGGPNVALFVPKLSRTSTEDCLGRMGMMMPPKVFARGWHAAVACWLFGPARRRRGLARTVHDSYPHVNDDVVRTALQTRNA